MTTTLDKPPPGDRAGEVAVADDWAIRSRSRSPGRLAWSRLRRDRAAMAGGAFILLVLLVAVFAPVLVGLLGHPPDEPHYDLLDPNTGSPRGAFNGISTHYLLGVEPVTGRDVFSRVVYGARVSLLVAVLATMLSVAIGTLLGVVAGYAGGWVDSLVSRMMDLLLAFPLLLFAFALALIVPERAVGLSGSTLRIAVMIFVIGFFNWPYVGRIVRGQTLSLRSAEFVTAARGLGARPYQIIFRELLPNLVAPVLVYATLAIPTNILFEAALSFLGVGVKPPTPSWGEMLSTAADGWYAVTPVFLIVPGMAIFLTVLGFNLFGDGLRDALDPRARR